ncbi:unnamed protein product [Cuscuta campestris]|uniref:Uncharacterized protein n=1 Tax=Cuscuta campestris TaxID=132261 RepID=A0A484L9I2_9ASTE|nr:unnamed protein product [Cuscuta campestris]
MSANSAADQRLPRGLRLVAAVRSSGEQRRHDGAAVIKRPLRAALFRSPAATDNGWWSRNVNCLIPDGVPATPCLVSRMRRRSMEQRIIGSIMDFGFIIVGSSSNGMSSEALVEIKLLRLHGCAVLTAALWVKCGGRHHDLLLDAELVLRANDSNDPLVAMVNQAWYHNNYHTINYILKGLAEMLYLVYAAAKLAKELWSNLNKKYQVEDAGTKKFIVGKMLDYKMVDSKSVVA